MCSPLVICTNSMSPSELRLWPRRQQNSPQAAMLMSFSTLTDTQPLRQRCSQIKALPLGDEIAAQHGAVTVDDSGGGHRDLLEQAEPFRPAVPSFPDHTGNDIEPRFTTPVDELVGPDLENSPVKRGHHSQHRVDQDCGGGR